MPVNHASLVSDQFATVLVGSAWWAYVARIAGLYALAWLIHRFIRRVKGSVLRAGCLVQRGYKLRPERQATLYSLVASAISLVVFAAATLISLGQFVRVDTLIWIVGLFSAAFGLGARPLISDVITGINFIFEDSFAVGEKVEILGTEGVVEKVNLRTTCMRSTTGELYVVPNGEVRVVRNFSRGSFARADVKLKIPVADLGRALPLLEELGKEAVNLLPNLLEPWQVVSASSEIGQQTELAILAKSRFGKAAEMRPRLLTLVHERLAEAGIALAE
jgi:small-conductance mechanosensitive channel